MTRWPAIRTPKGVVPGWRAFLGASIISLVVPVLTGIALTILASLVFSGPGNTSPFGALLFTAGFFLGFSIYLSWVGLLMALPLVILAFRLGGAGWVTALAIGVLTGGLIYLTLGMAWAMTLPLGAFFAAVFWLSLRWISPDSFIVRP